MSDPNNSKAKSNVALSSVIAAVFLTGFKLFVGLLTGSLGILSEALHSGLDLIAAVLTFFAVRIADKPPDDDHHYGHGKVENLSALIETMLLAVTCIWIVYEAYERLTTGRTHIIVSIWSFLVIILSILIDFGRSRALSRAAKKYKSQALEADALHFSTDILSSVVVLLGLGFSYFNMQIADSISALMVAVIVLGICYSIGKKSIDVLMDKSPAKLREKILVIINDIPEIFKAHDIRIRTSGPVLFIEMNIHVNPEISISQAHELCHLVENKIKEVVGRSEVHVHAEPEQSTNYSIPRTLE